MPELDGFELGKMIHAHPRFQNTAIIFISGVRLTDLDRLKGIRGMWERLRRLNGTLEIGSNGRGTRVTATIPLQGTTSPMRQGFA